MKVLVTGATGFVGGHIVPQLLAAGHEVKALVRSPEKAAWLQEKGVELSQGDLLDIDSLDAAMQGCGAVIHAAAQVNMTGRRDELLRVNGEGTRLITEAAVRSDVRRFVYISSMAVYRSLHAEMREDEPKGPWYAYGAGKWLGEVTLFETGAKTGLPVIALRPPFVYGDGVGETDSTRLVAAMLSKSQVLPLPMGGDFPVSWVHVETLASAAVSALTADAVGEAINVHDGHNVLLCDIIDLYRNITGRGPVVLPLPEKLLDLATYLPALRLTDAKLDELWREGATFDLENGVTLNLDKAKKLLPYTTGHNFLDNFRLALEARQH